MIKHIVLHSTNHDLVPEHLNCVLGANLNTIKHFKSNKDCVLFTISLKFIKIHI
jgi:hypothetical protein